MKMNMDPKILQPLTPMFLYDFTWWMGADADCFKSRTTATMSEISLTHDHYPQSHFG